MRRVQQLVDCIVRRQPLEDDEHRQDEDDEYLVHMVVLTASIGKKVPVAQGNITVRTMHEAVAKQGGSVHYMPRCEEVGGCALLPDVPSCSDRAAARRATRRSSRSAGGTPCGNAAGRRAAGTAAAASTCRTPPCPPPPARTPSPHTPR